MADEGCRRQHASQLYSSASAKRLQRRATRGAAASPCAQGRRLRAALCSNSASIARSAGVSAASASLSPRRRALALPPRPVRGRRASSSGAACAHRARRARAAANRAGPGAPPPVAMCGGVTASARANWRAVAPGLPCSSVSSVNSSRRSDWRAADELVEDPVGDHRWPAPAGSPRSFSNAASSSRGGGRAVGRRHGRFGGAGRAFE